MRNSKIRKTIAKRVGIFELHNPTFFDVGLISKLFDINPTPKNVGLTIIPGKVGLPIIPHVFTPMGIS